MYQPDGRLASVQKGAKRTGFSYEVNPTRIVASSGEYIQNGVIACKYRTIYLDNDNRAVRSEVTTYDRTTGEFSKPQKFAYVYENQRLVKCYNLESPNLQTTVFGYDTNGDLTLVKVENNGKVVYSDQYNYGSRGIPQTDFHPLNPQFSFFGEDYDEGTELMFLPVFGKFNKHLVQNITRTQYAHFNVLFNYGYKYTVNTDGHVTERERWNQTTNQKIEMENYQYKVESLSTTL